MQCRTVLFLLIILSGFSVGYASDVYKKEFELFKQKHELAFDKRANPDLRALERYIHNYKQHGIFFNKLFIYLGCIAVTPDSMPILYSYIDTICKKERMKIPLIFIHPKEGFFNAAACKLAWTCGAVMVGNDVITEVDDGELEAIITHEIGHVKHNHVNKKVIANIIGMILVNNLLKAVIKDRVITARDDGSAGLTRAHLGALYGRLLASLIIGKCFERQADSFACEHGKAEGLVKFMERLIAKEKKEDKDFDDVSELLTEAFPDLNIFHYAWLSLRYYSAKWGHTVDTFLRWVYHATPVWPHPSHESRIKAAQRYID